MLRYLQIIYSPVKNNHLDFSAVHNNRLDGEIDAYRRAVQLRVSSVAEPLQQARLAHTGIADKYDLEDEVEITLPWWEGL